MCRCWLDVNQVNIFLFISLQNPNRSFNLCRFLSISRPNGHFRLNPGNSPPGSRNLTTFAPKERDSMDNSIIIRQETPRDFRQVDEVVRQAFAGMEESDHTEHLLVGRLRKSDAYIPALSLVAETTGKQIVGHIMLSRVEVVNGDTASEALAVAPLSVIPRFQGRGIGGMLIREAHRRATSMGYAAALLLGHKGYYPRFGYKRASLFGIKFPFDAPDDYCMVAELSKGGLTGLHGMVRYPDAFGI